MIVHVSTHAINCKLYQMGVCVRYIRMVWFGGTLNVVAYIGHITAVNSCPMFLSFYTKEVPDCTCSENSDVHT